MTEPASGDTTQRFDPDAILAAERLTELLRRAGRLRPGTLVGGVVRDGERPTVVSTLELVRLEYEGDVTEAPRSLLLKRPRIDVAPVVADGARIEAVFYRDVAPFSPRDMLAQCFDASTGSASTACYVLLEDLSATHAPPTGWPVPPDVAACEPGAAAAPRAAAAAPLSRRIPGAWRFQLLVGSVAGRLPVVGVVAARHADVGRRP